MTARLALLDAVRLTELDAHGVARRFAATTQHVPWPKAYGGDLLAQAAAAAMRTVDDDRILHTLQSLFVAPADVGAVVEYDVTTLRDGRSYSTREVKGYQNGVVVVSSQLSFHVGEESPVVAPPMPRVPLPDTLPSAAEAVASAAPGRIPDAAAEYWSSEGRSFDIRHVEGGVYASPVTPDQATSHVWLRAFSPLPDDADLHRLALIHVCDYTILEPVLRSRGLAWTDRGLVTASLDHAMWLHDEARLDDWVLFSQTLESSGRGRGLVRGTLHSRDGRLLATVAQQGMIRIRADRATPRGNEKETP